MGKRNGEMTRRFHVVQDFAQFRKGEEVEAILYPDCFAVEGGGAELKIPYSEIQYVAHCDKPEAKVADYSTSVPYFFGGSSLMSFITETAVSVGMSGAERAAAPNLFGLLFFVGYYDGEEECWVMLQDEHNFETNPFVQELAARANTKVIHYFAGLERKSGI